MFVSASGVLNTNPKGGFLRNKIKGNNVKNCSIDITHGLGVFYRHLVFRKLNIILETPPTPPHITVMKDEILSDDQLVLWSYLKNRPIEFEYSVEIETTRNKKYNRYWYLPVKCKDAEEIRRVLKLKEISFHITFGIEKFDSPTDPNRSRIYC